MDSDDWFSFDELTGRLGALVWVEESLAGILDSWSRCDRDAATAVCFATAASHHRWHGEIVRSCLPTSPRLDAEARIQPPTDGWKTTAVTLASLVDPGATGARLKALDKVVHPWLEREINALLDLSRPVSDAAMMRWLRFVAIDHHDDGESTAMLLAAQISRATRFEDHQIVSELDLS